MLTNAGNDEGYYKLFILTVMVTAMVSSMAFALWQLPPPLEGHSLHKVLLLGGHVAAGLEESGASSALLVYIHLAKL